MRIATPNMQNRKLFVSFKVAERCNLVCDYCYFFFRGDESHRDRPGIIKQDTLDATARFLGEGARELGIPTIDVAIHGGEPLLVGKKRFRTICESLRKGVGQNAKLNLGVQTNAVLLDREWIDLFAELDVGLGISIDGPKHINDKSRVDRAGRGSYDKIIRALGLLEEAKRDGKIPGIAALIVVRPETSAREVYHHVVHELNIKTVDFMLPKGTWDDTSPDILRATERYALELLNCWLEDDDPSVKIRSLKFILAPFLTDLAIDIKSGYLADLTDTITIRSDGDVSPDDTIPSLGREFSFSGYNVKTSSLAQFYEAPFWTDIRETITKPPEKCARCKWLGYCGGGELVTRFSSKNRFNNPTIYCDLYKTLYARVRDYALQYIDEDTIDGRILRSRNLMFNGKQIVEEAGTCA